MIVKKTEIKIIQGDITSLKVDAIVNPASANLVMDRGLAGHIIHKGGADIEIEATSKGPISIGEALITTAGQLPSKHVIHTAIREREEDVAELCIRSACAAALECAHKANFHSIAFPSLGCSLGGFPKVGSAKIMAQEILKHIKINQDALKFIFICLDDEDTYHTFLQTISGYVTHLRDTLGDGPYVTVDIIIEYGDGIVIIERSNPPYGRALPGGFVDYGESLEAAAVREAKEETNLNLAGLSQFHVYSDPMRDPRFHTISTVFVSRGEGEPKSGDDACDLAIVPFDQLLSGSYAFDHKKVIEDYLKSRK
ncbi:MAG: macro domain-containing protein [Candidatus Omnitrophica bacterium]|nr:macro domain-containing protein [Candidatus Omnitrophota bacterium]